MELLSAPHIQFKLVRFIRITIFFLSIQCSSSCDGTVKVWNISDQQVIREWTDVTTPSNSFESAERLCHLSWETITGRLLAIPFDHDIKVVQRSTWNVMMTLSNNQLSNVGIFLS